MTKITIAPTAGSHFRVVLLALTLLAAWSCNLRSSPPFPEPEHLVVIQEKGADGISPGVSHENFRAWDSIGEFESVSAYLVTGLQLQGERPRDVQAVRCTVDLFATLGVAPVLGRVFMADEPVDDGGEIVVLSYDLWLHHFAGKPDIVGREIMLEGKNHTVLGVMPEGFSYPEGPVDLWLPLESSKMQGGHELSVIARLAWDVKPEQAEKILVDGTLSCGHQAQVVTLRDAMKETL